MPNQSNFQYLSDGVSFKTSDALRLRNIYAPLSGTEATGLKSSITPLLSGDIKVDKYHYLTKPASREDLRYPLREFFVRVNGQIVSLAGEEGESQVTVGQIWHQLTRTFKKQGVSLTAVNCVPSTNETVELMKVSVKNLTKKPLVITPTAAVPLFGRSLANKHDHEHVTALLNRIEQWGEGVLVEPTMAFNEEGHKEINHVYFVFGREGKGGNIAGSFPTVDCFYGDEGTLLAPYAVINNLKPSLLNEAQKQGKEAVGALRFKEATLKPGESRDYIIAVGLSVNKLEAKKVFALFDSVEKFDKALAVNKDFWAKKIGSINFKTGNSDFNAWMRWVTLQPVLRRIFGCSFLPDHDYGKGGKGWRDIWQDLLSLILIEPELVRSNLLNNCAGIRIDGSNATIIGSKPGEFIADRNAITRVWMDHGCWPFMTLALYINQTGDYDLLLEKQTYFRDPQLSRTFEKDIAWLSSCGNQLVDKNNHVYQGTILEHVLVEHLTQFFNVGKHNVIRLESADWNDGLDMAFTHGESVAFSSFYAGNLLQLADCVEELAKRKNLKSIKIAKEVLILLDTLSKKVNYDDAAEKHTLLFGRYFKAVQPAISGELVDVLVSDLAKDLRGKGHWLFGHIRHQEKVTVEVGAKKFTWFNGYYDNTSTRVEGLNGKRVRMTLTGQVFAVMSKMTNDAEVKEVIASVDRFLKDKDLGGYRLNTDFGLRHYLDLGRAFGFAYGTKENGAFFSHMIVMYAYALYSRGFAREGYKVLNSIYAMAIDTKKSKIYPGIPEYFDSEGRGMYHYLTGSASWLVLTQLTQAFGVRGQSGDLILHPQLVQEQFDAKGKAAISCQFAGKSIDVTYTLKSKKDVGSYSIKDVVLNGQSIAGESLGKDKVKIERALILAEQAPAIEVILS